MMRLLLTVLAAVIIAGAAAWAFPFPHGGGGPSNILVLVDASGNVRVDTAGNVMVAPARPPQTAPVPAILSVSLTGNGAFIPGISGAAGTAQATWTGIVGTITWTLQQSGTDHTGAACGTATSFTINSTTGTITSPAGATVSVTPCAVATASAGGVSGSPFVQRVVLQAGSVGSTTISPTPEQFAQGASAGTLIGTLSTMMSPPSLSFSGGSYTLSTSTPTCTSTNGANNSYVTIASVNQLEVSSGGSSAPAGNYQTCVHASIGSVSGGTSLPLTITSGSTVACDIGPPYTGSIPAAATQAGMTHCAYNYDFAQTSSWTDALGTHQWSNLSTWFTCSHASSGPYLWWHAGTGPCDTTHQNIITDSGVQVFALTFLASEGRSGGATNLLQNFGTGENGNREDPQRGQFYSEFTVKLSTVTPASDSNFAGLWDVSTFTNVVGWPCFVGTDQEFDQPSTDSGLGMPVWNHICGTASGDGSGPTTGNVNPINTSINTYGALVTMDGVSGTCCFAGVTYSSPGNIYGLPGSAFTGATGPDNMFSPNTSYLNTLMYTYMAPGENGGGANPNWVSDITVELYRYTIWECDGYNSHPCINNPVITTAP